MGAGTTGIAAVIEGRNFIGAELTKHYQRIAGKDAPLPSLLLVQAPIFHGHAFAVHVELEQAMELATFSQALAGEHVNITLLAEEAPTNVNAAGQGDVLLSIVPDPNSANSFWLWAASDNLLLQPLRSGCRDHNIADKGKSSEALARGLGLCVLHQLRLSHRRTRRSASNVRQLPFQRLSTMCRLTKSSRCLRRR
jgi:hypothetical protein